MHEVALCERIVRCVLEEFSRLDPPARRLCRVRVVAGPYHPIVPDYLCEAYKLLVQGTSAEGSEMELIIAPIMGQCGTCDWKGNISLPWIQCGRCDSKDVDILNGREFYLDCLEIEENA